MKLQQVGEVSYCIHDDMLVDLKTCSLEKHLKWGRIIHAKSLERRHELNIYAANGIISMYCKCGSMEDARYVFDRIQTPSVVSWNALLLGYVENEQAQVALHLFSMKELKFVPSSVTYVCALKACACLAVGGDMKKKRDCLKLGKTIHSEIGCHLNHYVFNALIDMYSKCKSISQARSVFDSMPSPDIVSWNALLLGYVDNGEHYAALDIFSVMKKSGVKPNFVTFLAALKGCTSLAMNEDDSGKRACLERGRNIHMEIGNHLNNQVESTLINMYATCGSMIEAYEIFNNLKKPDVISWTALLLGYAENGEGRLVLDLFSKMKKHECLPNSVTYIAVIKACGLLGALSLGRKFHSEVRHEITTELVTCLVDFYAKCGSVVEAREMFDSHPKRRGISTWNALLAGYGRFGYYVCAFQLFERMKDQGLQPNAVTFVCLLKCCSHAGLVENAIKYFDTMACLYHIPPSLIHYNCMVDVLGRANQLNEAIGIIRTMPCSPDVVIWTTLLGACRKWRNVDIGMEAFQALADINKRSASAYVLLAQTWSRDFSKSV